MTILGDAFLSAFLQALFEQLLSIGGSQFLKLIGGVDLPKTIKQWERQLIRMEALLDDAEQKQFHDKSIKLWLNDLQDLAYDMEDVLDHFATQARLYELRKADDDQHNAVDDQQSSGIMDSMVKSICASGARAADTLSTLFNPVDQDLRDKINNITERLEYIQSQTNTLSLGLTAAHTMQQQTLQTETLRNQRESTSLVAEPEVFGMNNKKKDIIELLLNDEQSYDNYAVIPIVGTGGIGKTTLAQYVYNDEQLNGQFDIKAWVCVSDVFDVKRITTTIFKAAASAAASVTVVNFSNLNEAQESLKQQLMGKKFLTVLDDIWNEEYDEWYKLQTPFRHAAKGSRVIMTTRTENIAEMMCGNHNFIITLEGLSGDDCWHLFQQHANKDTDLDEMWDDIVRKCNGLPLAAKALGGLLRKTKEKSQRQRILNSNVWSKKSNILPVLSLSYLHLPSHLKRIFVYCSVFPKDYQFTEMQVILQWMAHGFLPETEDERMEDIGHHYFLDLVSRSLFERRKNENVFVMHDLIHDMAQWAAGDVCYVIDTMDTRRDLKRTRHLFITGKVETLGNQVMAPQLRTVLCGYGFYTKISNFFQKLCYLRTLSLSLNNIEALPECIGDLKHLRYLELRSESIKVLPQSINNLLNLQTLLLLVSDKLEKVPNISFLLKLRYLFIYGTCLQDMPLGIEKLTSLQNLEKFVLAAGGGSRIRELGKLNHLHGNLTITGLENVREVDDAHEAQLYKKENLDKLSLRWGTCTDDVYNNNTQGEDVLEQLKPHTSIKACVLKGYRGSRFPGWLGDPSFNNMVRIKLLNCQGVQSLKFKDSSSSSCLQELFVKDCESIVSIGHIPLTLQSLYIQNCQRLGYVEFNEQPISLTEESVRVSPKTLLELPRLTILAIGRCPSLTSLQEGLLLPALQTLNLENCENMEWLPRELHNCIFLERLEITKCPKINSSPEGGLPTNLECLGINIKQAVQEWGLHLLHSLKFLTLENVGSSTDSVECIPNPDLSLPSSLPYLNIKSFQKLNSISTLPNLYTLWVYDCPKLESLVGEFTLLKHLWIRNCSKFRKFPEGGLPRNLKLLTIQGTSIDKPIKEWGLHLLTSLHCLELENVGSSMDTVECISDSDLPSSLTQLSIEGFQNLKTICCSTLPLLYKITIKSCPKFQSFGESGLPPRIDVEIDECDLIQHLKSDPDGRIQTDKGRFSLC